VFTGLYTVLLVIEVKLMLKAIRKGPEEILPTLQADIRPVSPVSPVAAAPGQA